MSIDKIILICIGLVIGYKLLNKVGYLPVVFRRISFNEEDFIIYLKLLFIRGYTQRGKGDGRFIIESMDRKGRKIIVRKYNFRNELGLCIYIPEYEKGIEKKMKDFLKKNRIDEEVWREWRRELDGKVIGVDIGNNFDNGIKILRFSIELILQQELTLSRLKIYFKNILHARDNFDFDIEAFEDDVEKRKKLEKAVNWMGWVFGIK